MEQNGHANVLVIQKSRNTMTVVKKTHTIKHLVIGGLHTRKVNYLSQTYEGKRHDKKIADEEAPTYPKDISLYQLDSCVLASDRRALIAPWRFVAWQTERQRGLPPSAQVGGARGHRGSTPASVLGL